MPHLVDLNASFCWALAGLNERICEANFVENLSVHSENLLSNRLTFPSAVAERVNQTYDQTSPLTLSEMYTNFILQ
jgi:hypothetical protein